MESKLSIDVQKKLPVHEIARSCFRNNFVNFSRLWQQKEKKKGRKWNDSYQNRLPSRFTPNFSIMPTADNETICWLGGRSWFSSWTTPVGLSLSIFIKITTGSLYPWLWYSSKWAKHKFSGITLLLTWLVELLTHQDGIWSVFGVCFPLVASHTFSLFSEIKFLLKPHTKTP